MPRPKSGDPLLNALIAKLPAPGTNWPAKDRQAWLGLMTQAFDIVYGVEGSVAVPAAVPAANKPAKASAPPSEMDGYKFYIAKDGTAWRYGGPKGKDARVMPDEVTDAILDLRPVSDLRTVVWADDSTGVGDHSLTVVTE